MKVIERKASPKFSFQKRKNFQDRSNFSFQMKPFLVWNLLKKLFENSLTSRVSFSSSRLKEQEWNENAVSDLVSTHLFITEEKEPISTKFTSYRCSRLSSSKHSPRCRNKSVFDRWTSHSPWTDWILRQGFGQEAVVGSGNICWNKFNHFRSFCLQIHILGSS